MARTKKVKSIDEAETNSYGKFTPSVVAKVVNLSLMRKPNKSILFKGFSNKLEKKGAFVKHLLNNAYLSTEELDSIIKTCQTRKTEIAEEEKALKEKAKQAKIAAIEKEIQERQKELEKLKKA